MVKPVKSKPKSTSFSVGSFLGAVPFFGNKNNKNIPQKKSDNRFKKNQEPVGKKPYQRVFISKNRDKDTTTKIFKANIDKVVVSSVKSKITPKNALGRQKKSFLSSLHINKNSFQVATLFQWLRLFLLRYHILAYFNRIIAFTLLVSVTLFIVYLSFFDTFFLVKTYKIQFSSPGSYISEKDLRDITKKFQDNSFLGVLPGNQFWFLSNQHLLAEAKSVVPEVQDVKIVNRVWPNEVAVDIKTQPILFTLGINGQEYWRISKTGKIMTRDDAGLRERLIVVRSKVSLGSGVDTFENYTFETNQVQMDRFGFINWLWAQLDTLGIEYVKTSVPSLFDTDVLIQTRSGTELRFDAAAFTKNAQLSRLEAILKNTKISEAEKAGSISYIDFRIAKRVFYCPRGSECDK